VPALLLIALVALLVPIALVRTPPVLDYPNHMARLWLVAGNIAVPPMSEIYALDWSRAALNSGMDLIAWAIGPALGGEAVARVILGLSLVLPPAGSAMLARTVSGRWPWTVMLLPLLAWNQVFLAGFMNFQIGIGLACFAASGAAVLRRRAPRFVAPTSFAAATCLCLVHPFAGLFFAGLLGAERFWDSVLRRWSIAAALRAAAPAAAAILVLVLLAPVRPGQETEAAARSAPAYLGVVSRMLALLGPLYGHYAIYELPPLLLMIALLVWGILRRHIAMHRGFAAAAGMLALAALLGPVNLADTGAMDIRLATMAMLVFVVALRPPSALPPTVGALTTALLAASLARTAWVGDLWLGSVRDTDAVRAALAEATPGSAILPVGLRQVDWRTSPLWRQIPLGATYANLPALAIPERTAFVPSLFSAAGKQPIRVLPPWNEIAVPDGILPEPRHLSDPGPETLRLSPYLANWPNRFDFVLVLNADHGAGALPDNLHLVRDAGFAQLWRIVR